MFFRKKTKQPQTEEQLQKEQKKRIGKEVDQMIRMALGFENLGRYRTAKCKHLEARRHRRTGYCRVVCCCRYQSYALKRGLSLCYRGG